jgi:hypothetical protein
MLAIMFERPCSARVRQNARYVAGLLRAAHLRSSAAQMI